MDINFVCEKCGQELAVDESLAGVELECPACHHAVTAPTIEEGAMLVDTAQQEAAYERNTTPRPRIAMVQGAASSDLIQKPKARPLSVAAQEDIGVRCKTFLQSETADFDETVSAFLTGVGKTHILATHPVQTDKDFGVMVIYEKF